MATITILSGFALMAEVTLTPDDAAPPTLVLTPVPNQFYGAAPFPLTANSNSNGAITFSILSGPATLAENVLTVTGLGLVTLQVAQQASGSFLSALVQGTFVVNQASSGLEFFPLANITYEAVATVALAVFTLSSGALAYYIDSGPATLPIGGSILSITGAGTVVVGVGQYATEDYTVAAATTSFLVFPATPTLAFLAINAALLSLSSVFPVTASSNSAGAITYSVLLGPATVAGNLVTITGGGGAVTLKAQQAATTDYAAASTTISFAFGASGFGESFGTFGSGL